MALISQYVTQGLDPKGFGLFALWFLEESQILCLSAQRSKLAFV
jgi:hypothetical protein